MGTGDVAGGGPRLGRSAFGSGSRCAADVRARARLLVPGVPGSSAPTLRDGVVRRRRLLDALAILPEAECLVVAAPAGYGKTTALATLVELDERPCAWVSLDRAHDDPTTLLAAILLALDDLEPLEPRAFEGVLLSEAELDPVRLSRFAALLEGRLQPFVLVLDDAHLLHSPSCTGLVQVLVDHVPPGSRVAIGTRDSSVLHLGRARAQGRVAALGIAELTMSSTEAAEMLRGTGLDLSPADTNALHDLTEGWPAGLYLCSLAAQDPTQIAARDLDGRDGPVAEYLRDEILAGAPADRAEFMIRTSILDRMSGASCDAVLDRRGSGAVLDELARNNWFVVPFAGGEWYRYHQLFQDLLGAELRRRAPEEIASLHVRASCWFEANGDIDEAVRHAREAGDRARVGAVVWAHAAEYLGTGRTATVRRWLDQCAPGDVAAEPALALSAAYCAMNSSDTSDAEAWVDLAEAADRREDDDLPDGTPTAAAVALMRAIIGRGGLTQVRADAARALALDRVDSPYRAVAHMLEGAALRLLEEPELARESFERAGSLGAALSPAMHAQSLGFRALLADDERRFEDAARRSDASMRIIDEYAMDERPAMSLVFAVAAFVAARGGESAIARDRWKHAHWLIEMLRNAAPWLVIEAWTLLGRTSLLVGSPAEARACLGEADRLLATYPDAGLLPQRIAAIRGQIDGSSIPLGLHAAPITAAERRVLRYLPTHLSFAEIADALFVSRNTVKSQAIAVYRKLEVSSRAKAVERARAIGLLDP